ncbi:cupin domain-containing protein [Niallia nealsonii]|uniref:Cupin n=1 Tax=Niallia nealsonii TaxID=115979 RepID=A0A2N0Z1T2_9BACI|nr:cupin domain-containing protein [Niallia nealsonii]PKG23468.1 cupin [Niallia nealsonii]
MQFYQFKKENGFDVINYQSIAASYTKILKTEEQTNIGFMHIEPNGKVGYHQAPVAQLYIVVEGEGWIEGEDKKRIMLKSGEGVFWEEGEGHASGSDGGMTALVIQSVSLPKPHSLSSIE